MLGSVPHSIMRHDQRKLIWSHSNGRLITFIFFSNFYLLSVISIRGVINGKAGKAAALPKFSDSLTLSQPGGSDYAHTLALPHLTIFYDYVPGARSPEAPTSLMSARYCLIKIPQLCTLSLYIQDRKNMQIIKRWSEAESFPYL